MNADTATDLENAYCIRQDVFGVLPRLKTSQVSLWWMMVRTLELNPSELLLPKVLHKDARSLVEQGLLLEVRAGTFKVSPDIAYLGREPRLN